jgi:hypothetical protein
MICGLENQVPLGKAPAAVAITPTKAEAKKHGIKDKRSLGRDEGLWFGRVIGSKGNNE